ncbi:MAG TPA: outer membrane beta-barrel protein [Chlorobiota bacterium]|nr:outer membrane beta-barrel protein [Chlorobiota bacterium]
MKRIVSLLLVVVAAGSVAVAQDVRNQKNDFGLLFTLNGLDNLSAGEYNGGAGAQWYLANDVALRFGLGFATASQGDNQDPETTVSGTAINISPGVRFNLANNSNVVGYVGGQVMFGMASTKAETSGNNNTEETSSTGIGVGAFLGAEWFPWKNVSLSVEYGLGFMTSSSTAKSGDTEADGPSNTSIYLGAPSGILVTNGNDATIIVAPLSFTLSFYIN